MRDLLDTYLVTEEIVADLLEVLKECAGHIELNEKEVEIPKGTKLEVVAKSFHYYNFDIGFGDHYRVLVAIGGVERVQHGVPSAALCFATLWYSAELKLITVDFSTQMP